MLQCEASDILIAAPGMRDFDHFHDKLLVVLVMLTLMNDADFDNNAADDELRSCRSR